jgi:tetratricopeptide (TPR) repeat protein
MTGDPQMRRAWLAALAAAVVAGAAYAPVVRGGFVWDDRDLVVGSGVLGDGPGLARALRSDLYAPNAAAGASGYWRPAAVLSYWLNARLGTGSSVLHAGNVALHALVVGLLGLLLARALGPGGAVAGALGALLWALHPEQVEAVAWISCRYELLAALAAVAWLLVPKRPGARSAALAGGVFLAGLLSKESFVGMAAVVLADDWAARRPWRDCWRRWVAVGAAIGAWAIGRHVLGIRGIAGDAATLVAAPGRLLAAVAVYAVRAVAPLPLSIHHPFEPGAGLVAAGAAVCAALGALVWRRRDLAPAAALFVAGLAPTSTAMGRLGIAAERYFYLPSLGLAWISAAAIAWAMGQPRRALARAAPVAGAAAALAFLPFTVGRFAAWRDDDALFRAALEVDPGDAYAHLYLGRKALDAGRLDVARRHLEQSLGRDPGSADAAYALADVHLRGGEFDTARAYAARAVELEPVFPAGWLHVAWACHGAGDHRCELAAAERAVSLAPEFVPARVTAVLARCEVEPDPRCERGIDDVVRGQALDPMTEMIFRASAALRRGDAAAAAERIDRMRRAFPGHPQIGALEAQLRALGGGDPIPRR